MKTKPKRRRHPRRIVIPVETLLRIAGVEEIDASWRAQGYALTKAGMRRCKDGSFTAQLTWRDRSKAVSTVGVTVKGICFE